MTVTHPDMTRFFMTIPEAVQLVLQASAMGEGGDLFVLDMGEQVRILDLAETMIRLSGYRSGVDIEIEIEITGPRPGEKMDEEILTEECAGARIRSRICTYTRGIRSGGRGGHRPQRRGDGLAPTLT